MVSDCCGSRVVFHGVCSCCGERCRVVGEDDSYLDIPDNDDGARYDVFSDDAYDDAVQAYWNGYGPPVTRRQREDEEMEREEYRRIQRGGY